MLQPRFTHVDVIDFDLNRAYLDDEGKLRFLSHPVVEITREELMKMYPTPSPESDGWED